MALSSFLKSVLQRLFGGSRRQSPKSGLTGHTPTPEYRTLSRFIFESRHFSRERERVKPSAFLPSPNDLETSVLGIDNLTESEIWISGDEVAGATRGRSSLARADIKSSAIAEVHLTLHSDPPPLRHMVLRGWPVAKDEQKAIALDLSLRSLLRIRQA